MSTLCGTEKGYQRHRYLGQVTCQPCCDAHAVAIANWRARTGSDPVDPAQTELAAAGAEPAEALHPDDRGRLVHRLHNLGLPDVRIAEVTAMSTYTTARIRSSLGLAANRRATEERPA